MPSFVLASRSPARAKTLRSAGIEPVIIPSGVDEEAFTARYDVARPSDVALMLARAKCEAVAASPNIPDDAIVLGCDSVLDLEGRALGKPADSADAVKRWHTMRGRTGILHTGHWLIDARQGGGQTSWGTVASTTVEFAHLSDDEVAAYVSTGEPLHVAGAFTVDGLGGAYVRSIDGDFHNVVGISLPVLRDMLREIDVSWHELWTK